MAMKPQHRHGLAELEAALKRSKGNVVQAARDLGLHEMTFRNMLERLRNAGSVEEQHRQDSIFWRRRAEALEKEVREATAIRDHVLKLAAQPAKVPRWMVKETSPMAEVPVLVTSDFQWGEVVKLAETNGINEYNLDIAKRRYRALIAATINISLKHQANTKYPGIVYLRGGDSISGDIHLELLRTNQVGSTMQVFDLLCEEAEGIKKLADAFGRVVVISVPGNHGRTCFDEETELLTKRGWLRYDAVREDDIVGTLNPETKAFEWQPLEHWRVQQYSGPMVTFDKTHQSSLCVTPEHDLYIKHRSHTPVPGGKCYEWDFKKRRADERPWSSEWLGLSAALKWEGSAQTIVIPGTARKDGFTVEPDGDFAEFLGWFVSEGTADSTGDRSRITISQSLSVNPEKHQRIIDLLARLGHNPCARDSMIRICNAPLCRWLADEFGADAASKRMPRWLLDWPTHLLERFMESAFLGDGYWESETAGRMTTTSDALVDAWQEIGIKLGWGTSSKARYGGPCGKYHGTARKVHFRRRNEVSMGRSTQTDYSGAIWCPTVANGLVFVRRNGHAIVSGNSIKPMAKQYAETNYDHLLSLLLERQFRDVMGDKRVTFFSPVSGDHYFHIYSTAFLLTHGDRMGSSGGQGFIGPAATIMRGVKKTRDMYAKIGKPVDWVIHGHFHSAMMMPGVISNGTTVGYSEYAMSFRAEPEPPSQTLFFVNPKWGVNQYRKIVLEDPPQKSTAWFGAAA